MATSNSWDFSQTSAQVIQATWEDLGILIPGGTIVTAHQTMALARLNTLVKQWQGNSDLAPGLKIYSRQRISMLLAKGQHQYTVGPAATDARASTAMGRTTVSSAYASGTSLSVTALTDTTTFPGTTITMTASDIIGVQLNDGTIAYTTISAAASSPITLGGALASAAAAGNYVWWFTARAQRFPLLEAAVLRYSSLTDTPLDVYTDVRQYELGVANKYADGAPTAILVEPFRLNTRITLNSQPTDVTSQIVMTVQYPAEDYDATANDIAMPQEGYAALSWELAKRCAPAMRVPWTQVMDDNHKTAVGLYRSLNPENSVLYFQPNA